MLPALKEKKPYEYFSLKQMRDRCFSEWQRVAADARKWLERGLAEMGVSEEEAKRILSEFEAEKDLEILKTLDTLLFPETEQFRGRLSVLVKRKLEKRKQEEALFEREEVDDDLSYTEEERVSGKAELEEKTPLDELLEKEGFSVEKLREKLLELGLFDEAECMEKILKGKGRLSKYEMKKLRGALKFLLFALGGKE